MDAPQLELLDRTAFQKRILHKSVGGVDSASNPFQLCAADRATIFCEIALKDHARPSPSQHFYLAAQPFDFKPGICGIIGNVSHIGANV